MINYKDFKKLLFLLSLSLFPQKAEAILLSEYIQEFKATVDENPGDKLRDFFSTTVLGPDGQSQSQSEIFANRLSDQIIYEGFSLSGLEDLYNLYVQFSRSDNVGKIAVARIIERAICLSSSWLMGHKLESKGIAPRDLFDMTFGIIFSGEIIKFRAFIGLLAMLEESAFDRIQESISNKRAVFFAWGNLTKFFYRRIIESFNLKLVYGNSNEVFVQIDGLTSVLLETGRGCKYAFAKALLIKISKEFSIFLLNNSKSWDGVLQVQANALRKTLNNFNQAVDNFEINSTNKPKCALCKNKIFTVEQQIPCGQKIRSYHPACLLNLPTDFIDGQRHCPFCRESFNFNEVFEKWLDRRLIPLTPRPLTAASSSSKKGHRLRVPPVAQASTASLPRLGSRGQALVSSR